jgi:hypothetical protein
MLNFLEHFSLLKLGAGLAAVYFTSQQDTSSNTIIDYGHDFLPFSEIFQPLANVVCAVLGTYAFYYSRTELTQCMKYIYANGMLIKATLLLGTILPDSKEECRSGKEITLSCQTRNDMLPSGHMMFALTCAYALTKKSKEAGFFSFAGAALCGIFLVASRMHYTTDVVLSAWLTFLLNKTTQMWFPY